jgi:hypothetical protein
METEAHVKRDGNKGLESAGEVVLSIPRACHTTGLIILQLASDAMPFAFDDNTYRLCAS